MQRICKPIGVLLAILMIVPLITVLPLTASALGTYVINGKTIMASDSSSSHGQCWAYANAIYKKIWGVNFTSQFNTSDNLLRDLEDEELTLTAEHLKAYVLAAELGASLRICNSPNLHANDSTIDGSPGHNQIIVQKDDEGFTVIQGGLSASPYYAENYYTWDGYVNTSWLGGRYSYIKYVKWPGAPSYAQIRAQSADGPFVTEVIAPTGNLLLGKSFSLAGVIHSAEPMTSVKGEVIDEQGNAVLSYTKSINSTSYNISTGGMDSNLKFGRLIVGGYHYVISATDAQGTHIVWDSYFTVCPSKVVNEEKIYNFLINRGFNKAAVCAVLANIQVESNFSPTSTYTESGGYNSYGLCQWNLSRLDNLITFCQVHGYSQSSLEGQLLFMLDELQNGKYQTYRDVYNLLVSIPDTEDGAYDAAYLWTVNYEIPLNREAQGVVRGNLAKEYFLRYSEVTSINLTLNSRGGSAVSDRSMMYGYPYGVLPSPTRAGCTFDGWYTMPEDGTKVSSSTVLWATSDQVLYAHWIHNTYQITYVLDGERTAEDSYCFGTAFLLPADPVREGYVFEGWYANAAFTGDPVTAIASTEYGAKTYYAKWRLFNGLSAEEGGVRFYENGVRASGMKEINGSLYYFDPATGFMRTESGMIDGTYYYAVPYEEQGVTVYRLSEMKNGFIPEDGGVRYYVDDEYQTGWLDYGEYRFYFIKSTGLMKTRGGVVGATYYYTAPVTLYGMKLYRVTTEKNGFLREDGGIRYYEDGVYATGWKNVGFGQMYFRPDDGLMESTDGVIDGRYCRFIPGVYDELPLYILDEQKNGFFAEDGGVRFYEGGEYVTGWRKFEGNDYYFNKSTGLMKSTSGIIGATVYYVVPVAYMDLTLYRMTTVKNGFVSEDGGVRYYRDGVSLTGWQTIDQNSFYFLPETGLMETADRILNGKYYPFEPFTYGNMTLYRIPSGKSGFYKEGGGIRLYAGGSYVTGKRTVEGLDYYFYDNGFMRSEAGTINGRYYYFAPSVFGELTLYNATTEKNGFVKENGGVRFYENGTSKTGWKIVDGDYFYFDTSTGLMKTSRFSIGQNTYYPVAVTVCGLALYRMTTLKYGLVEENGVVRYYIADAAQVGWQTLEGYRLFFDLNSGNMLTQKTKIGSVMYWFLETVIDGVRAYYAVRDGVNDLPGGIRYYREGEYQTGWQPVGEYEVYFRPYDGYMNKTDITVGGIPYYVEPFEYEGLTLYRKVNPNGVFREEDGGVRFYEGDAYATGWREFDGDRLYFNKSTGLMKSTHGIVGSVYYYFEPYEYHGLLLYRAYTGKSGFIGETGGVRYYEDGAYRTGWLTIRNDAFYFDPATGYMKDRTGAIDGTVYYPLPVSYQGLELTSLTTVKNGFVEEDGGVRYYEDGTYRTGWMEYGENTYYFIKSTGLMKNTNGLVGSVFYYVVPVTYQDLTLWRVTTVKNGLVREDGGIRLYDEGTALTGWHTVDGYTLYFNKSTGLMKTTKGIVGSTLYLFRPVSYKGMTIYVAEKAKIGFVSEDGGIRYYVEGEMQTGWLTVDGGTLYFDPATGLMACESRVIGGTFCCFEAFEYNGMTLYRLTDVKNGVYLDDDGVRFYVDGVYQTGWQTIAGWQVYFTPGTGLMHKTDGVIDGVYRSFVIFEYNHLALYGLEGEGGDEPGQYTISDVTALLDALANGDTSYTISDVTRLLDLLAGR